MFSKWALLRDYVVVGDAFVERFGRVNVWTVLWDKKKWPLYRGRHSKEVAVSRGSTVPCHNNERSHEIALRQHELKDEKAE